tara:strand:- start:452 stop:775 length:324 start_codon:yes stop_codon:yes gene_type:complete
MPTNDGPSTPTDLIDGNFDIQSYAIENLGAQHAKLQIEASRPVHTQTPFILGSRTVATLRGRNPFRLSAADPTGGGARAFSDPAEEPLMDTTKDGPAIDLGEKQIIT